MHPCAAKGGVMKKIITIAVLIFMAAGSVMAQQSQQREDRARITVNGEAVVYVNPDKITVVLGIETWDPEIMAAKQKNNDILKKTLAELRESGVPEKEIQTDHLSIAPRYENDNRRKNLVGYFVRNSLVVNLTEADKLEALISRVLLAGVNYIKVA